MLRKCGALARMAGWMATALAFAARRSLLAQKPLVVFSPTAGKAGSAADLRAWAIAASLRRLNWDSFVLHPRLGIRGRKWFVKFCKADIMVLQQTRLPLNRPDLFPSLPCVLDVDDADIINRADAARIGGIARQCKRVIAGSRYIASLFSIWNEQVEVVWTGTYLHEVPGAAPPSARGRIVAWAPSDPFGYPDEVAFVKTVIDLFSPGNIEEFRIYGVPAHKQHALISLMQWGARPAFVRFMPAMPYKKFVASLAEVAIGLQPVCASHEYSLGKSFGKILAYLVADVAVVASNNVDHPLFFRDEVNGRLLPNESLQWRDACLGLLDSPIQLDAVVAQARKDFMLRLTSDKAAALVSDVLLDVLAEQKGNGKTLATTGAAI